MMYPSKNNDGYGANHWTSCSFEADARARQQDKAIACEQAGTHKFVSDDGAYGMICKNCGETYMRDRPIWG